MNINISVYKCVFLLKSDALNYSDSLFFLLETSLNINNARWGAVIDQILVFQGTYETTTRPQ